MTIGKRIEKVLEKQGMTKTHFAKELSMTRSNTYDIFSRTTIDTDLLQKIGEVLHHDFFQYYRTEEVNVVNDGPVEYKSKKKSRISLLIEIDPDEDLLSDKEFNRKLKELMRFVSE